MCKSFAIPRDVRRAAGKCFCNVLPREPVFWYYTEKQYREKIAKLYAEAESQGDEQTCRLLRHLLHAPVTRERNTARALEWYTKAADQAHSGAQSLVANMYEQRQSVPS